MQFALVVIAAVICLKCFKAITKMIGCLILATVLAAAFAAHIATNLHF